MDILITEPLNEKDDNNIVPEGLFNLQHERPYDQSRAPSPVCYQTQQTEPVGHVAFNSSVNSAAPPQINLSELEMKLSNYEESHRAMSGSMSTTSIGGGGGNGANGGAAYRSRPITPSSQNSRPPSPVASLARSRPASPSLTKQRVEPIPELDQFVMARASAFADLDTPVSNSFIDFDCLDMSSAGNTAMIEQSPPVVLAAPPTPLLPAAKSPTPSKFSMSSSNAKKKEKRTFYSASSSRNSQGEDESSSSSDDDDDEQQKFQIRIRPKSQKLSASDAGGGTEGSTAKPAMFVPLLPRPPKSPQEIEEFRQRRYSSDNASITKSIKEDESSDDAENTPKKNIVGICLSA